MMLKLFVCLLAVLPVTVARTRYDKPFLEECPSQQSIYWIKSHHNNHREDREWDFYCMASSKISTSCQWYNEINQYDKPFHFQCPRNGAIVGVQSYHSNHHEDRIWSYKCCDIKLTSGASIQNCVLGPYANQWDGRMDYKITLPNQYLRGVYSRHDNHREDRIWKFETCTIV